MKKQMNKAKYFEFQINFWSGKLKVRKPIIKLKKFKGGVAKANPNTNVLTYNHRINEMTKFEILLMALHELGHFKTKGTYTRWGNEYKAHKFALKAIKKHLPKLYKKAIKFTKSFTTPDFVRCYVKAFTKLLEDLNEK